MDITEREKERRVRNVKRRVEAAWRAAVRGDKTWLPRFRDYEDELVELRPWLPFQDWCGLIEEEQLDMPVPGLAADDQLNLGI